MDVTPPHQQPATDNDELAKVLAGIGGDSPTGRGHQKSAIEAAGLQFEETPAPGAPQPQPDDAPKDQPVQPQAADEAPATPTITPTLTIEPPASPKHVRGELDDLKKATLEELRPLVTKLNLPPEEKFDTLLLIIRSTDDTSLLDPAHETAKLIPDEARRAQALLDIIKEIDYFSAQR